jgi:hypothetical protein
MEKHYRRKNFGEEKQKQKISAQRKSQMLKSAMANGVKIKALAR